MNEVKTENQELTKLHSVEELWSLAFFFSVPVANYFLLQNWVTLHENEYIKKCKNWMLGLLIYFVLGIFICWPLNLILFIVWYFKCYKYQKNYVLENLHSKYQKKRLALLGIILIFIITIIIDVSITAYIGRTFFGFTILYYLTVHIIIFTLFFKDLKKYSSNA